VRYLDNVFHNTTFGNDIYRHNTAQSHTPTELNQLQIPHSGVDKGSGNTWTSRPDLGALLAAPTRILSQVAAGDTESSTKAYLGWAWDSAGSATLDGGSLSNGVGWGETSAGTHTLSVDGTPFQATVGTGPTPAVTFVATPSDITPGQQVTLSWNVTSGTFLDVEIDQGLSVPTVANGQVVVTPSVTTTYTLHAITQEGGVTAQATVCVNCESPLFEDGFETGNVSRWSTAASN
jgi:hypothetical protein